MATGKQLPTAPLAIPHLELTGRAPPRLGREGGERGREGREGREGGRLRKREGEREREQWKGERMEGEGVGEKLVVISFQLVGTRLSD